MLKLFEKYHYLTVKQAAEILGATQRKDEGGTITFRAVQSRLQLMTQAGYLIRSAIAPDPTVVRLNPVNEWSYRLDGLGLEVVTGVRAGQKSPASANHEQDLTDFHTAVLKYPGKKVIWEQTNLKRTVNPDAMFGLSMDGKDGHFFFLEYERSRVNHYTKFSGNSGLVEKVRKYDNYRMGKLKKRVREDWKLFDDFRVIFIVKDNDRKPQARKKNLLKKLVEMKLGFRRVWIATDKEFLADPMGKVFQTPADYEQTSYSLLDV